MDADTGGAQLTGPAAAGRDDSHAGHGFPPLKIVAATALLIVIGLASVAALVVSSLLLAHEAARQAEQDQRTLQRMCRIEHIDRGVDRQLARAVHVRLIVPHAPPCN